MRVHGLGLYRLGRRGVFELCNMQISLKPKGLLVYGLTVGNLASGWTERERERERERDQRSFDVTFVDAHCNFQMQMSYPWERAEDLFPVMCPADVTCSL